MSQSIFQIDAFTDTAFKGNPAAVCLLENSADDAWMQIVAREMNLAETAFLERREDGYGLRWFTPGAEVDLCGHATLASAHFLWEQSHLPGDQLARFHTRSGLLTAERDRAWIVLDFPALPATATALARTIATRAPLAVRAAKEAILRGQDMPLNDGLAFEDHLSIQIYQTEDAQEGPRAFAEKRDPTFTGR